MKNKKNINERIDQKIIGKGLERIDDAINNKTYIRWKCKNNHIWENSPFNILYNNANCIFCNVSKITNDIVDNKIINRGFTRLDDINNGYQSIVRWQCHLKSHIWRANVGWLLKNNKSCPTCGKNNLIDKKLLDQGNKIIRISDYINSASQISWKCNECKYTWKTNYKSVVFNKTNCPECQLNKTRLTNKNIDEKTSSKSIIRLDDVFNSKTKIRWKCNLKNHIFWATPNAVIRNKFFCKSCYLDQTKFSDEKIDNRLSCLGNKIKRKSNFISSLDKMSWECNLCHYQWSKSVIDINNISGCIICNKKILTNQKIDARLVNRNIKRLDNVINSHTNIWWSCLVKDCNYTWKATPSNILQGSGCCRCLNKEKFTNHLVDKRLINRPITRLEDVIYSLDHINWRCDICLHIWRATPSNVISGESGCPKCASGRNEKIVYSKLIENNIDFEYHYYFNNILNIKNKRIFVDFYLEKYNTIIEYNGKQHYAPVCFGGCSVDIAKQNFAIQQERDKLLQQLCDKNNINLIWIDGRKYVFSKLEKYMVELSELLIT